MSTSAPYSYPFDLVDVPLQGTELRLAPDASDRARIAPWLGVIEVPSLVATVRLSRLDDDSYGYEAQFAAEVVQACVVTLDPVRSTHAGAFSRRYRVVARATSRRSARTLEPEHDGDDEIPEVITTSVIDLAAPLLEELSLVLDPYPRAPGVTFEPPKEEPKTTDNPFAVLAKLKPSSDREPEPRK